MGRTGERPLPNSKIILCKIIPECPQNYLTRGKMKIPFRLCMDSLVAFTVRTIVICVVLVSVRFFLFEIDFLLGRTLLTRPYFGSDSEHFIQNTTSLGPLVGLFRFPGFDDPRQPRANINFMIHLMLNDHEAGNPHMSLMGS